MNSSLYFGFITKQLNINPLIKENHLANISKLTTLPTLTHKKRLQILQKDEKSTCVSESIIMYKLTQ